MLATDNDTNVKSKTIPAKSKTIPAKRQKTRRWCGSAKYSTKYRKSWEKKYDFVKPSSHSDSHYFCGTVCQKDVSIKNQGALDIQRHSEGKIHKQKILFAKGQFKLSFKSASHRIHDQVTAAEIRNMVMIAHHNAALCLADHIGPMLRASITDSQIVKGYHCARTKTVCIIAHNLNIHT